MVEYITAANILLLPFILTALSANTISIGMMVNPLNNVYSPRPIVSAAHLQLRPMGMLKWKNIRSHDANLRYVPNSKMNASKKFFMY